MILRMTIDDGVRQFFNVRINVAPDTISNEQLPDDLLTYIAKEFSEKIDDQFTQIKKRYAPYVYMTKEQRMFILNKTFSGEKPLDALEHWTYNPLFKNTSQEEMMRAWLNPETIKIEENNEAF